MDDRSATPLAAAARRHQSLKEWVFLALAAVFISGIAVVTLRLQAVPVGDLLFVLGYSSCVFLCDNTAFRPHVPERPDPTQTVKPLTFAFQPWTRALIAAAILITNVIPWSAIALDPREGITRLYAPHLFLHMSQVVAELWSCRTTVATPTRVLIPVGFTLYRFKALLDFYMGAVTEFPEEPVHMYVALAMTALWGFVFFVVLLVSVLGEFLASASPKAVSATAAGDRAK